jgi:large subunit ribosomal protein L21
MGYAVISSGGKQYKVQEGETVVVERLDGEVGAPIVFDHVLMHSDGENVTVGTPVVQNAVVKGHVVDQDKHRKIVVFKYKRRKGYRRKQGHRQPFTRVKIDQIAI